MKKRNYNYIWQVLAIIIINIIVILFSLYIAVTENKILFFSSDSFYFSSFCLIGAVCLSIMLAYNIGKNNKNLIQLSEIIVKKEENIQELEKAVIEEEQNLLDYTVRDQLTGVNNKLYIDNLLDKINETKLLPVSVILIDINGLNIINNNFGYNFGDELLIKVADILKTFVRDNDVLARYGFDEFIIVMVNTPIEYAKGLCKKIENTYEQSDNEFKTGLSFGIASRASLDESFNSVLERAKQNLNIIKLTSESRNIAIFKKILKEKKKESSEHCQRIKLYAVKLGHMLRLSDISLANLELLAYLHDLGKIATPDFVLNKPGILNDEEREVIKTHPEIGYNIAMSFPHLRNIAIHILQHHERWDGKGYPSGLAGEQITIEARIIAIVDAYEAMISKKNYRTSYSVESAVEEIERCSGTQFDPYIARIFVELIRKEHNL